MKKIFATLLFVLLAIPALQAQVYLIDALKPVEKEGFRSANETSNNTTVGSHEYYWEL